MLVVPALIAVLGGAGVALQALLIGDAGADGRALPATTAMFLIGAVLLSTVVLASRRDRAAVASIPRLLRARGIRLTDLANGIGGAATVVVQAIVVGPIGVAMFTVGFVAGQVLGGLGLDAVGAAGQRIPMTPTRVLGGLLTLCAVGLVSFVGSLPDGPSPLTVLAAASGLIGAWIGTASARVNAALGRIAAAASVNFVVGVAALGIAAAGQLVEVVAALADCAARAACTPPGVPRRGWRRCSSHSR